MSFQTSCLKKNAGEDFTYIDAQAVTNVLSAYFMNKIGLIPKKVKAACDLSLAVIAPSNRIRLNHLKSALGLAGGSAGIGLLIGALGTALGWGASTVAVVTAFFTGTSLTGPIGFGVLGVGLASISVYFAFHKDSNSVIANKFAELLKKQSEKVVELLWSQYGEKLD